MIEELIGNIWIIGIVIPVLLFVISGLKLIHDDQVGIVIKKMLGPTMPQGQVVALNGEVGVQADILMPGLYWRIPIVYRIEKKSVISIKPNEIGLVDSIDGKPIPKGRLLGDEVESNHFQDAKMFLGNGGFKGPQIAILRPGTYRINTYAFKVKSTETTVIGPEHIGVVTANDGQPLPSGFIIAPKPINNTHQFFQDGQAFIDSEGYRGPQLDTLQPGRYYINPLLFRVSPTEVMEVPPGFVAVLRSNVGMELEKEEGSPIPNVGAVNEANQQVAIDQAIHEDSESLLILEKNKRGIWKEPVAPGKYNLNPLAFTPYLVPTSAVTIDWASGVDARVQHIGGIIKEYDENLDGNYEDFFKFSQLRVTSKDGFGLDVDVRMIIRIRPDNAGFVIARFGSIKNLIEQIVHPLIDSSFRNKAGEKKAIDFIMGRTELQKEALTQAQHEFAEYHVEAQNLLIAYIKVDQALLETQTRKEIAIQQQAQYIEEAKAQDKRIEVQSKNANAEKQPEVVSALLSIDIEKNKAEAKRRVAEGDRDFAKMVADGESYRLKTVAEGEAYQQREVGKAIADAYKAQADVLGPQATTNIKLMNEVGTNAVKIVPEILVQGGGKNDESSLVSVLLAQMVKKEKDEKGEKVD